MNSAKNMAIGGLCIVVIAISIFLIVKQTGQRRGAGNEEYDEIAGAVLGKQVSQRIDKQGELILITLHEEPDETAPIQAALRGFKEALDEANVSTTIHLVSLVSLLRELKGDGANAMLFGEEGIPPFLFDHVIANHSKADAVVSLIGFPSQYKTPKYSATERPVVAGLDLMLISGDAWIGLIRNNYLDFLILPKLRIDETLNAGTDEEIFEKRYHLVSKENLDEAVRDYLELY